MTEELQPEDDQQQPNPGPTKRLEKAIEDMGTGEYEDGTLVSIEAHTGEHPVQPEPSVTEALNQVKGKGKAPDIKPAVTMYEPTKAGQAARGSNHATQYGPTGSQGNTPAVEGAPQSGTMNAGSGPRPIAPFGGKIVVGTRFGQIEVTGVLGKGGMGEVFKGYHHALDINVAIKVLPDELSRNELVRQRFLREARLCVKLDHPHIVRVFNVDEYAGNLYLVMEMVEGTDAAHMLKNGGRFRYKRALEIGAGGADALAYAHSQGLVHRDVKPHNILLGATDGRIKLSDFGLARAATSSSHLTMSGQIMGTPHYMSPEQAESKEVSDKSDVYSLGVSLYHMLTGETPFIGDTPISVAVQHIAKEILYPEIRFKPFPKELVAVLKRMTAKDPAKRCSAKQAAVWLRKLITMAPADDIQSEDDGAMKSMAPVVRESAAFEAAAKEREARDFQARELARTMLATIQEDSGRRPAVPSTMQEQAPAPTYSSQPQAQNKSGTGALVGALVAIIVLLAGGGAGWYFMLGPGADKANNEPIIAGGNNGKENRETEPRSNKANVPGNTPANNAPANNDSPPANDGGPTLPDDGGTPPAEKDDPLVASALSSAAMSITNASTLADLDEAKMKLTQAKAELPNASQAQRDRYKELEAQYNRQRALLAANEGFTRIRTALAGLDAKRGSDNRAAIAFLNTAIKERDALSALKVPPEAEELVVAERDALVERVNGALDDFWTELDAEAARLEKQEQYAQAESLLAELASINHSAEKIAGVSARLQAARILDIHKTVRADLAIPDFTDAMKQLALAEEIGVPEALKAAHDKVVASVGQAIESKLEGHLNAARAAADKGEFLGARAEQYDAVALPGKSADQTARVADVTVYIDLSEHLLTAETALADKKFSDSSKAASLADGVVAGATGRTLAKSLTDRLEAVWKGLDTEVAKQLEAYLASATSDMQKNNFAAAGSNLQKADELPLSHEQRTRLEAFKTANETAMADFVRSLIASIEKALNENNFEAASAGLATADSLSIPKDMEAKIAELRGRFATEAVKRHGELLDTARGALAKRNYKDARAALDSADTIPVAESEKAKAAELNTEYNKLLDGDVSKHLDACDKHLADGKYLDARDAIDAAAALPLSSELDLKVRKKRDAWKTAVEVKLAQLIKSAEEARDSYLYKSSDEFLKEAEKLPLNNDQLVRSGIARDDHDADLTAYKTSLFKQLQECVDRGQEKEGRKIEEKLQKVGLSPSEQLKLKGLVEALTGETEAARRSKLPKYLEKLWDHKYCRSQQLIKIGEEISAVAVTPDGKFGAAGTVSGKVLFYNLKRGTQLGTSSGGRRRITCIAISPDGTSAVSGNDDGNLVLFDLSGTNVNASDLPSAEDDVFGIAFASTGSLLYVATSDGMLHRYNPRNKSKLGSDESGLGRAQCMQLSPDDKWIAVGGQDGEIAFFEAGRMVLTETLDAPGDDLIQSLAFSADSGQLIAGSIGDSVGVWNTKKITKKPIKEYIGLSEWVRGVGFTSDGNRCAAFDNEERLVVWDVKKGFELGRLDYAEKLKGEKDFLVVSGVIGPDGTILIGTREGELLHMRLKTAG